MLVSVIVPVYDVKQYLNQCLDSIINQSYTDLEIILVNDGSTDGSGSICDEYAKKDTRVRVIHQKNKGLSGARNTALNLFKGEYVCFVDSDDWIEKDYILDFVKHTNKKSVVCCGYSRVEGEKIESIHVNDTKIIEKKQFINLFLDNCLHSVVTKKAEMVGNYAWNKLWPKESFDLVRFPQECNYEDIYVFIELLKTIDHVRLIPSSNYNYRIRENSICKILSKKNMMDAIKSRIKQERDLNFDVALSYKAKILTTYSICGLFAEHFKNRLELTDQEKIYYKKCLKDRIIFNKKYKTAYIKSWMILHCSRVLKMLYKFKS